MGQVLHGSATTTEAIRRAIQHSKESLRALSRRYGINQKTVRKWKARSSVVDRRTGPKEPRSTVLSIEEEAVIVGFRRHTLLPLDDCLYALQPTIPHLTRSSLHRCLQRHGSAVLLKSKATSRQRKSSSLIRSASSTSTSPKCRRARESPPSSWRSTELRSSPSSNLPKKPIVLPHRPSWSPWSKAVPYKIHTVLTDNGIQFRLPPRQANAPNARYMSHMFALRCREHGIEHRFTKINHPWTNGQVERMNRTIKDATVKRYHYDDHDQLRRHLADFVAAYNFARRLKTLKGLTPYEFVSKCWTSEPDRFKLNPLHQMPGLNT